MTARVYFLRVTSATAPQILLVMGVSGSGKSTVGAMLAGRLGWAYAEADDFHPAANVAKMHAGIPLTDDDRLPWLHAIAEWMDTAAAAGEAAVVTCSALKRRYRDYLRAGRPYVRLIYLDGDKKLIVRRMTARQGHFFPARLLDSQFSELEPPRPDEHVLMVSAAEAPGQIVDEIVTRLRLTPQRS
jgi:gluconokinase